MARRRYSLSMMSQVPLGLLSPLYQVPEVHQYCSDQAVVDAMVAFECALADVEGRLGIIPQDAARVIVTSLKGFVVDPESLVSETKMSGNPAIPLVKTLQNTLGVGAGDFVHFGATSQDVLDSALMICARNAYQSLLALANSCGDSLVELAQRHRRTLGVARTLSRPAVPITAGFKVATWLSPWTDAALSISELLGRGLPLQSGGAGGTSAAYGSKGLALNALLGEALGLCPTPVPWHSIRTPVLSVMAPMIEICSVAAKIGSDLIALSQVEFGEVIFGAGSPQGGSSSMPQKHNPTGLILLNSAYRTLLGHYSTLVGGIAGDFERPSGPWHATIGAFLGAIDCCGVVLDALRSTLQGVDFDEVAMRSHYDQTKGAVLAEAYSLALRRTVGRNEAARLVGEALAHPGGLVAYFNASTDATSTLDLEQAKSLGNPDHYLGQSERILGEVVARWTHYRSTGTSS